MMSLLNAIEQRIAYSFKDQLLLQQALTHKSYANENKVVSCNERMEFLGDAVLNLSVSEYLMKHCPESSEGDLSRYRAAVVNEASLAGIARSLDLGSCLLLGKGEEQTGGRNKDSLLSDSLEALIASVYLDAGREAADALVVRLLADTIARTCVAGRTLDHKTELQELFQEKLKQLPEYRVVSQTGPDHQKEFTVELCLRGEVFGRGCGRTKKEAEQKAAKEALHKLAQK